MPSTAPPPIRRRKLAVRLTELRKAAGLAQTEVAEWTGLSQTTISRIEQAKTPIEVKHVRLLCACYSTDAPELDQLLRMAAESEDRGLLVAHGDTVPDYARDYTELEGYASRLWVKEAAFVFGPLQTPDYTRAARLSWTPDASRAELDRSVALRKARGERLRGPDPLKLRAVHDEAVFHWSVGGPKVMAEQLTQLIEQSTWPNIDLRIVPFSHGPHRAMGKSFSVLTFEDTPGMDVAYVENERSAAYLEKPSDLAYYVDLFEQTVDAALSPEDSRSLLATLRAQLWEQPDDRKG
ncbi:hypothetical protein SUDANB95_05534 [Actinosynnema sp. ALI-1.44]